MPHRQLFLELHPMCMYESCAQVRLLMQTVEHKQADQRRHSAMHPGVHRWIPEGNVMAAVCRLPSTPREGLRNGGGTCGTVCTSCKECEGPECHCCTCDGRHMPAVHTQKTYPLHQSRRSRISIY